VSKNEVTVTLNLADVLPVIEAAQAEIDELRSKATQRGARMQILRVRLIEIGAWHQFLHDVPKAADWFHDNGVPR
jgi:hypothetical protein